MYNRREFIIKIFRTASLATLALGSGYLLFRQNTEDNCDFDFVCRNCKKIQSCHLPEAENFLKKQSDERL